MSNHRRSQSENCGSKNAYPEPHHADKHDEHFLREDAITYRGISANPYSAGGRTTDDSPSTSARAFASTRPAPQVTTVATVAQGDPCGVQASPPIHFGESNSLFPMALQNALYQELAIMDTAARPGPPLAAIEHGGRVTSSCLTLESRIAASTSNQQPDTSSHLSRPTSMMRLLSDMTGDSNEQLPPWTEGLLGQRASILSQQHPIPSTASQGRGGPINAVVSTQRTCYPVHQHGNSQSLLSSLDESDPIVSMLALHIALQQQLDTISSNRRSDHLAAIINTQASSPVADSRSMITNPLTSQLAAVLSSPIPTLTSPQRLGISPNISVSSRLQQILNDGTPVRATNLAVAQSSTVEHPLYSSAALATIAAMMLQDGDGCGALTHTPHGTAAQRSSMSASTGTSSTNRREADSMRAVVVGVPQNEASLPTVGMARPLPALPTLQHHALLPFFLQDPTILAALPAAMSIPGGGRMPQAHLPTPLRLPLADSRGSSLSLRGPLGHFVEHRKLPRIIHVPSDDDSLSPYQCLVRKQIQLFEASEADINATAQGRNRPIIVGQVGIRCIHCGRLPIERRARGAVYFPSTLMSTYQTAQNMANSHLMKDCREIPKCIRDALIRVRLRENSESQNTRKSAFGGGRAYWARGLQMNHGVIETDDRRLKFGSF